MIDIKKLRIEKGLTQQKLAELCGLSIVTINKAENTGKMRLSTYQTILYALNTYCNNN
jgi:transcriptional regulator with XRE-family HTH domain